MCQPVMRRRRHPRRNRSQNLRLITTRVMGKMTTTNAWAKEGQMPMFEGEDPLGWITRTEKFFDAQRVDENHKLHLAFINIEGNTIFWFQHWKKKTKQLRGCRSQQLFYASMGAMGAKTFMRGVRHCVKLVEWLSLCRNSRCW